RGDRAREDPRMTAAHRALAPRLEREAPHLGALAAADERARAAARLAHQADRAERHLAIDRLAHVVERQARDRDRGERFHLDAGPRGTVAARAPLRARLYQPSLGSRHTL